MGCTPAPTPQEPGPIATSTASPTTSTSAGPAPGCPDGTFDSGSECKPFVTSCPDGSHPSPDKKTCIADETPAQRKVESSPCPAGMALVKGGTYKMSFLKVDVTVGDVCLDLTEATTKDYEGCVTAGTCNANFVDACTETTTYKKPGKEDHPMVCIDFNQAETFCKFQNKRLPTEEEWEWAARGGAEGRQYSWGNDAPAEQACWSGKSPRTGTCPVKAHPQTATPEGLLGMSGNVFEWTTSKNDSKGKDRVGRGGSWRDGLANLLLTGRPGRFEVKYRCGFLGVRCAVEPKK